MQLTATPEFRVVTAGRPDRVDVLVDVTAPTVATAGPRTPATLQVVLDVSGSMRGDRLDTAVAALLALVDRLHAGDRFGVVTFDTQTEVVVPAGPLTDKDAARQALRGIRSGGGTDLSAGYLRGLQEAARVAGPAGARVLLLSDGHANAGVTDPERLGEVATRAYATGTTTSVLGIGLGYDEELLDALARGGRGAHGFAEEADTATALITGEVDGLLEQVAQAVSLRVHAPGRVRLLNDRPATRLDDGLLVELGAFCSGEHRSVVLSVDVPAHAELGPVDLVSLELTSVALPELVSRTDTAVVPVTVVSAAEAALRTADPVVVQEALFQQVQTDKRRTSRLLARGRTDEAADLLRSTSARLSMSPDLAYERNEVDALLTEAVSGSASRAAKQARSDVNAKSRTGSRRR